MEISNVIVHFLSIYHPIWTINTMIEKHIQSIETVVVASSYYIIELICVHDVLIYILIYFITKQKCLKIKKLINLITQSTY